MGILSWILLLLAPCLAHCDEPAVPASTLLDQAGCSQGVFDQRSTPCDHEPAAHTPAPRPSEPVPIKIAKYELELGRELDGVSDSERPKKIEALAKKMLEGLNEPGSDEEVRVLSEWLAKSYARIPGGAESTSAKLEVDLQGQFHLVYTYQGKPSRLDLTEYAVDKLPGHTGPQASALGDDDSSDDGGGDDSDGDAAEGGAGGGDEGASGGGQGGGGGGGKHGGGSKHGSGAGHHSAGNEQPNGDGDFSDDGMEGENKGGRGGRIGRHSAAGGEGIDADSDRASGSESPSAAGAHSRHGHGGGQSATHRDGEAATETGSRSAHRHGENESEGREKLEAEEEGALAGRRHNHTAASSDNPPEFGAWSGDASAARSRGGKNAKTAKIGNAENAENDSIETASRQSSRNRNGDTHSPSAGLPPRMENAPVPIPARRSAGSPLPMRDALNDEARAHASDEKTTATSEPPAPKGYWQSIVAALIEAANWLKQFYLRLVTSMRW